MANVSVSGTMIICIDGKQLIYDIVVNNPETLGMINSFAGFLCGALFDVFFVDSKWADSEDGTVQDLLQLPL